MARSHSQQPHVGVRVTPRVGMRRGAVAIDQRLAPAPQPRGDQPLDLRPTVAAQPLQVPQHHASVRALLQSVVVNSSEHRANPSVARLIAPPPAWRNSRACVPANTWSICSTDRTCDSFMSITILRMIDSPRRVTPLEPPIRLAQIPSRLIPHWNVEPCSRLTPRWKRLGLAIVRVIAYNERFENTQN
jgi:hypothetical protein